MNAQLLRPDTLDGSRYPVRELVEEREISTLEDAIEEMTALPGSWLIVTTDERAMHWEARDGKWAFKVTVSFPTEEK